MAEADDDPALEEAAWDGLPAELCEIVPWAEQSPEHERMKTTKTDVQMRSMMNISFSRTNYFAGGDFKSGHSLANR